MNDNQANFVGMLVGIFIMALLIIGSFWIITEYRTRPGMVQVMDQKQFKEYMDKKHGPGNWSTIGEEVDVAKKNGPSSRAIRLGLISRED